MTSILHVGASDSNGGAQQAMVRIHQMLADSRGSDAIESSMIVNQQHNPSSTVRTFPSFESSSTTRIARVEQRLNSLLSRRISQILDETISFPSFLPSGRAEIINDIAPDVVNLHWLGKRTLSISDIRALKPPIMWTLHDQAPLLGFRHYRIEDSPWIRFGGLRAPKKALLSRLDSMIARVKMATMGRQIHFVAPSEWMRDFAVSRGISHSDVSVIPNPLPTAKNFSSAVGRSEAIDDPSKVKLLFISSGGTNDRRKGFWLLSQVLRHLDQWSQGGTQLELVLVGKPSWHSDGAFERISVLDLGELPNEAVLSQIRASDLVLLPSIVDNAPLVSQEALAQGTPVFALGGVGNSKELSSMRGGAVAVDPSIDDVFIRLVEVIRNIDDYRGARAAIADEAMGIWSPEKVVTKYVDAVRATLERYS